VSRPFRQVLKRVLAAELLAWALLFWLQLKYGW
jgi:hypothetical protein